MKTDTLSSFAASLRRLIQELAPGFSAGTSLGQAVGQFDFERMAPKLFALQYAHNPVYRRFCEARRVAPDRLGNWPEIPALPTVAFKEADLSCLPVAERVAWFQSSGTTSEARSKHWQSVDSLATYEVSLWAWFSWHLLNVAIDRPPPSLLALIPAPEAAPNSSLAHMFGAVAGRAGFSAVEFAGRVDADGTWIVDDVVAEAFLERATRAGSPVVVLGTAFSFIHFVDQLAARGVKLALPRGSRVMETGGYKGRSRELPKAELHRLIGNTLGVPARAVVCEYGMCELSSQAYDLIFAPDSPPAARVFRFPPWARVQVVSPETGREVAEGETGLIRVFDLANVYSVMAVQTEDLGVRLGDGFELLGRAARAESRGCSLLAA